MPVPISIPTVARTSNLCCFAKCCPCLNLTFLKTTEGILKLVEVILGSVCQNLLISYGIAYILTLGSSFYSFLTASSACMMTSFVLLVGYVMSPSSIHTMRSSLFETLFNSFGALLYLSSATYLAIATHTYLYPMYKITSVFETYPAMSGAYMTGFILSGVHAYDAYLAYNT